jgi:hypothetical protein
MEIDELLSGVLFLEIKGFTDPFLVPLGSSNNILVGTLGN